jgi:N-acetylated-alpha-linked acidic dipeptidase
VRAPNLVVGAAALVLAAPVTAQTGFTAEGAARQRTIEAAVLAVIEPAEIEAMARTLSARPHVAGTPGLAAVRDTLAAWLQGWGLVPETPRYQVYLPHATAVSLSLVAPERLDFALGEPELPDDPATAWPQYPWVNGYSAAGTAEGDVVYAGYGLYEDYAALDSLGIDVAGRVVIARYGQSYRGVKARLAGERGASALILYSDPDEDGFTRGDVVPQGPMRPWQGAERGSVLDGTGDPTTPDGPSVAGAPRAPARGTPAIPVVPISYGVAAEILSRLEGAGLPSEDWQGALPFRYHVGPGPARVRLTVDDDRDGPAAGMKDVIDVTARIEGSEMADEWIVLGGHIDAWGPGANDNVSGTTSAWAVARALASLEAQGMRPRRTIVVAGWDGEEWGLIGSTEWVEEHAATLAQSAVAYLNQDAVGGTRFGVSASPALKPLVREAAAAVPVGERAATGSATPGARTLAELWRSQAQVELPPIGDLGGGSDFSPFSNHMGIPSINHGFGTRGGVYHSHYDTWNWVSRFGDPGYRHHALSAELLAILALRLANAEIHPFDYAAFGEEMTRRWRELRERAAGRGLLDAEAPDPLGEALAELGAAGERLAESRDDYLAGPVDAGRSGNANRALRAVERELTRPEGLVGRPWFRNLLFAADLRNGYATLALPSIAEAVEAGDAARLRAEIDDLATRIRRATASVEAAAQALD